MKLTSDLENLRLFECKFYGPTNKKCSSVKIFDARFKKSVIVSRHIDLNFSEKTLERIDDSSDVALYYLRDVLDIKILFQAWNEKTNMHYFLTNDFSTQLSGIRG